MTARRLTPFELEEIAKQQKVSKNFIGLVEPSNMYGAIEKVREDFDTNFFVMGPIYDEREGRAYLIYQNKHLKDFKGLITIKYPRAGERQINEEFVIMARISSSSYLYIPSTILTNNPYVKHSLELFRLFDIDSKNIGGLMQDG
ncbi:MAG: hypothetical protein AABW75_05075 [Nanoarchaeota archaeon]